MMGDEAKTISEKHGEGACDKTVVPLNQKADDIKIKEESHPIHQWRRQNLFLNIPSRNFESPSKDFVRINMPPTPSPLSTKVPMPPTPSPSFARKNGTPGSTSARGKSSMKNLLPRLSFKYRNPTLEIEKASVLSAGASSFVSRKTSFSTRSFSFTKIFTPRTGRTSSLPVTPGEHSTSGSGHGETTFDLLCSTKKEKFISRSQSMPVNGKERNTRRMGSTAGKFRVIPSTPRVTERSDVVSAITPTVDTDTNDDDGEDIPEEEAVCRICFIELGEGGETLKMECNCKGELALAHQECAIKWFTIKGNRNCDVCKQEVQNLPVTLLRIQTVEMGNLNAGRQQRTIRQYRICQGVPILVIISVLGYFCLLEQLLVSELGTSAIVLSLPFSCMLGLLASMLSATMVRTRFVWVYASLQFALVGLFANIFYRLLNVQPVLSILLATFAGLGVMMSTTSVIFEVLKWRKRWHIWLGNRHGSSEVQLSEDVHPPQTSLSDRHGTESENSGIP